MKKPKIINVFRIAVNYKSGISVEFDCKKFTIRDGSSLFWESHNPKIRPIDIALNGVQDIESIWQVGVRKALVWE